MDDEPEDRNDGDLNDAEMALFMEFEEEVVTGRNPDLEAFLSQHAEHEARLRPLLEMSVMLYAEVQQFKREHPGKDPAELIRALAKLKRRD